MTAEGMLASGECPALVQPLGFGLTCHEAVVGSGLLKSTCPIENDGSFSGVIYQISSQDKTG